MNGLTNRLVMLRGFVSLVCLINHGGENEYAERKCHLLSKYFLAKNKHRVRNISREKSLYVHSFALLK